MEKSKMTCCKVPIKISGFSGGCAKVTAASADTAAIALGAVTASNFVSAIAITNLAYLGLKCVNIACPPTLVVADTLGALAAFLDANLRAIGSYRDSSTADINDTATKAGLAALIAGCGCSCAQ